MRACATEAGIETIGDFFTDAIGRRILQSHGAASVVIANNMIANADNLDPLVIGVRDVLAPDGLFVSETQYGADVTEEEPARHRLSRASVVLSIKPLTRFFARLGMEVIDVQHIWTKGGSIRVTVQRAGGAKKPSAEVARFIAEENRLGVDQPAYYAPYVKRIAAIRDELVAMADAAHARGQLVAGYGVSVGTTTLLPQFGLENKIDFLVDDDPKKGNVMAGPGYDIRSCRPRPSMSASRRSSSSSPGATSTRSRPSTPVISPRVESSWCRSLVFRSSTGPTGPGGPVEQSRAEGWISSAEEAGG